MSEERSQVVKNDIKINRKNYSGDKPKNPGSLGRSVGVLGHCDDGDDEKDDGGAHTTQEIHEGPLEALESLVELGGVGEEQEESYEELHEGGCQKGCCCRRHKTHKGDERQRHFRNQKHSFSRGGELFTRQNRH